MLAGNPHRFNLGRLGFLLLKTDGSKAVMDDLKNTRQEVDMWNGIIYSYFTLEEHPVTVKTACHPTSDAIGISVKSDLVKKGQIKVFLDFPYPDSKYFSQYIGDNNLPNAHSSTIKAKNAYSATIARKVDDSEYFVSLNWTTKAQLSYGDTVYVRAILTVIGLIQSMPSLFGNNPIPFIS